MEITVCVVTRREMKVSIDQVEYERLVRDLAEKSEVSETIVFKLGPEGITISWRDGHSEVYEVLARINVERHGVLDAETERQVQVEVLNRARKLARELA